MASWSVCSLVAEPPELLCAFAAHYLDLGAEEVHLFLDAPDPESVRLLSAIAGVRITECDAAFWHRVNKVRPERHVMRQLKIANHAYAECRGDWFFFCDADEFLVVPRGVGAALDRVVPGIRYCRPAMAERVFEAERPQQELFDGRHRLLLPPRPKLIAQVYGGLAPLTTRGFTGHVAGKSFVRSGQADLRIRLHFPVPRDEAEEARRRAAGTLKPGPYLPDSWLVHFDGITPLHWQLKLLLYYLTYAPMLAEGQAVFARRTPGRSRQLNALYEARSDSAALARMMGLIRLTQGQFDKLDALGGLLEGVALDPATAARCRCDPALSFSARAFDDRLWQAHGALIAEYGLGG